MPMSDFQSWFFMSSYPDDSDSFSLMYEKLGAHFLLKNVFTTSFFETLFFKPCPNFASKAQSWLALAAMHCIQKIQWFP